MPRKKTTKSSGGSTAAKQKISVGQKVLIAVGILAGLGAIAAGFGSFDYEAYKRRRLWYAEQQAKMKTAQKTSQTVQTQQKKQAYQRVYPGMVIKQPTSSQVFYVAADFKKYAFQNQAIYDSWFAGTNQQVTTIPSEQFGKINSGNKNVRFRPGSRPIKIQTSPKVYTITKGGVLHEIVSEQLMAQLYGPKWALKVTDISYALFAEGYTVGAPMTSVSSPYHPTKAKAEAPTIDHDLGLK